MEFEPLIVPSKNLADARSKGRAFYREIVRRTPTILLVRAIE